MKVTMSNNDNRCVVNVEGRLDTNTAPELESALGEVALVDIVLECSALEYVSSAGLRVILAAHKRLTAEGRHFTLRGIGSEVRSVLDMTGFSRILSIE